MFGCSMKVCNLLALFFICMHHVGCGSLRLISRIDIGVGSLDWLRLGWVGWDLTIWIWCVPPFCLVWIKILIVGNQKEVKVWIWAIGLPCIYLLKDPLVISPVIFTVDPPIRSLIVPSIDNVVASTFGSLISANKKRNEKILVYEMLSNSVIWNEI